MKNYKLISKIDEKTIFSGFYKGFITCLEDAVLRKIPLHNINLNGKNLTNANLDDGLFANADFSNTNLTGVNLSESYCKGANFSNASLFNTCLAYSNLINCNFKGASFGATDMSAALLDQSEFSTLSAFSIDFTKTKQMRNCIFIDYDGCISTLSKPPIVITGIQSKPIILMDDQIYFGQSRLENNAKEKYIKIN
ncbi:MAG: pentapeptide repeat-containing protein [Bdellovibrionales bacterium]